MSPLGRGIKDALNNIIRDGDHIRIPTRELTDEEKEYGLYALFKSAWYFHDSSWQMRGLNREDGKGCSGLVCSPECKYYPEKARMKCTKDEKGSHTHTIIYDKI